VESSFIAMWLPFQRQEFYCRLANSRVVVHREGTLIEVRLELLINSVESVLGIGLCLTHSWKVGINNGLNPNCLHADTKAKENAFYYY
jgi:hypothetical protein